MRTALQLALAFAALGIALPGDAAEPESEWLLSEFEWGDSMALVDESVRVAPNFRCTLIGHRCALASAIVDGEELLVEFGYYRRGLYRIFVGTPELGLFSPHLKRIWELLAAFMIREKGPPEKEAPFPDLREVRPKSPSVTHFWKLPDQEIRLEISRHERKYKVGVVFLDAVRAAARREGKRAAEAAAATEAADAGAQPNGGP